MPPWYYVPLIRNSDLHRESFQISEVIGEAMDASDRQLYGIVSFHREVLMPHG